VGWLEAFAQALQDMTPGLLDQQALYFATRAHPYTWLLDPDEAAQCWLAMVEAHLPTTRSAS
jgi:hypothetical protein